MEHGVWWSSSENSFRIVQVDSLMGPSLVELAELLIKGVKEGKVANGRSVAAADHMIKLSQYFTTHHILTVQISGAVSKDTVCCCGSDLDPVPERYVIS